MDDHRPTPIHDCIHSDCVINVNLETARCDLRADTNASLKHVTKREKALPTNACRLVDVVNEIRNLVPMFFAKCSIKPHNCFINDRKRMTASCWSIRSEACFVCTS